VQTDPHGDNVGIAVWQAMQQATTAYTRGHWAESERWCRRLLAARADHFAALNLLGIITAQTQRVEEAAHLLGRAVAANPAQAPAHNNYGNVLKQLKRFDEALASYERALAIKPAYPEALNNRGLALQELKRLDEALACYDQALAVRPINAEALYNRGNALQELKRLEEALASYERALAIKPDYAEALNNRGNALQELRRFDEALASYDQALAVQPDHAETLISRGNALQELKRFDEALASYDQALGLRPNHAEALCNRGLALQGLKRLDEAFACFDQALAVKPDHTEATFSRGIAALLIGDFSAGWSGYESRWDKKGAPKRKLVAPFPHWKGESIADKKIIVYEEQGIGDVIQFSRYLRLLTALGAQVTFFVRPNLLGLMRSLDEALRVLMVYPAGESFDYQSALLSLPLGFGTSLATIPADTPYLRAEPERVRKWTDRIGKQGFKIGIAWQGNKAAKIDNGRSFALVEFLGVSQIPNVRLISLQKNEGVEQLRDLPDGMQVETLGDNFDADDDAFLDTAAVMENLDLVISSDTAIAHLAGALGRPVWVALRHVPDWRWLLDRTDSAWYPTMRLFRQRTRDDWRGVFSEIEAALLALLSRVVSP
jgi:tetratricopeptide (TPR) repeat protein